MAYEYDILDIDLPIDIIGQLSRHAEAGQPPDRTLRLKINAFLKEELNKVAKDGWQLHESGLSGIPMVVVYREKTKGKKKNVR